MTSVSVDSGISKISLVIPFSSIYLESKYFEAISSFSWSVYPVNEITSKRSKSGGYIVSIVLAVAINKTLERSKGTFRKWSLNWLFWAGSSTSNKALLGSPLKSLLILSISSNNITGFATLTLKRVYIIVPGIDPMYVLLWPLISASSLTPPKAILANFLPRASAIDFPNEVFPTPGGPYKHIIDPLLLFFNCLTARNSTILFLTFSSPAWSLFNTYSALTISLVSTEN